MKGGPGLDTYIVRIYRPPDEDSHVVLGVVEPVGSSGLHRFSNFDELREIICKGKGGDRQDPTEGSIKGAQRKTEK